MSISFADPRQPTKKQRILFRLRIGRSALKWRLKHSRTGLEKLALEEQMLRLDRTITQVEATSNG